MAEKRMFSKLIIDSDAFLNMPASSQMLYFHLCMRADDDGFVNNPRTIQRMTCASDDDFKLLLAKRFILPFESGIIVIKHWRIHNYIQKDRYVETKYMEEKSMLGIKKNKAYTFLSENDDCVPLVKTNENLPLLDTEQVQNVSEMDTQKRLEKNSKEKSSKDKETLKEILSNCGLSEEVKDALYDFIDMRKQKKRPLTPRALKMVINKLQELSKDSKTQVAIVNQTILHNWDTVYALKSDYGRVGANGIKLSAEQDHTLDGIF